jgi:hypothetical protein
MWIPSHVGLSGNKVTDGLARQAVEIGTVQMTVANDHWILARQAMIWAHLERIQMDGIPICVCMMNYETIDHIIWEYSKFEVERRQLLLGLAAVNIKDGTPIRFLTPKFILTPIRDLCVLQKWAALRLYHRFLRKCGLKLWGNLFFVFRITGL